MISVAEIRQYNRECQAALNEANQALAKQELLEKDLQADLKEISAIVGYPVTTANLDQVYEEMTKKIENVVRNGRELLDRINNGDTGEVEQFNSEETANPFAESVPSQSMPAQPTQQTPHTVTSQPFTQTTQQFAQPPKPAQQFAQPASQPVQSSQQPTQSATQQFAQPPKPAQQFAQPNKNAGYAGFGSMGSFGSFGAQASKQPSGNTPPAPSIGAFGAMPSGVQSPSQPSTQAPTQTANEAAKKATDDISADEGAEDDGVTVSMNVGQAARPLNSPFGTFGSPSMGAFTGADVIGKPVNNN